MTEVPRVNFVMREALFKIYTLILCLSYLHEKQTSRIQSLYLNFRPNKKVCVFPVTCPKKLGKVGRKIFFFFFFFFLLESQIDVIENHENSRHRES